MNRAVAYERKGRFFIRSASKTTVGVWIDDGACFTADGSAPPVEIGAAVQAALAESRTGVPHPTDWKHVCSALLAVAGVRSMLTFERSAKRVEIVSDEQIVLSPTRNRGRDGFVIVAGRVIVLPPAAGSLEIGQALLSAFAASE